MSHRRLYILVGLFMAAGIIILARLAQIQILWHDRFEDDYKISASGDRLLDTTRGSFYGAGGAVIARDAPSFDLSIHYSQLAEDNWLPLVSRLTGRSGNELRQRADGIIRRVERIWQSVKNSTGMEDLRIVEQNQFHPIVENISEKVAVLVRSQPERFSDLRVSVRRRREYPADVAPHIIGRCRKLSEDQWNKFKKQGEVWSPGMPVSEIGRRYRMDDVIGVSGLEREYEADLRGERGYVEHELYFYPLRVEKRAARTPPDPGYNLHLKLRVDFQKAVNDALNAAANDPQLQFRSGALVILDVATGGILAAGTYPGYKRETFNENYQNLLANDRTPFLWRPTQAALPTGSVYKLISAVAGLEEDVISPETLLLCEGRVRFGNRWFNCTGYHGRTNVVKAIEHSCNAYFFRLGAKLSGDDLTEWGHRFGMGQSSGIDFPTEIRGQIPVPSSLFGRLNLVIGQGQLLCTPIQVARAMAAIANGGRLVRPHFVSRITNRDGEVIRRFEEGGREIDVAPETLRIIRRGMKRVVNGQGGTARRAGLQEYKAAGKTGTAELGSGQPNHAWFAGFLPYDDPKIAFAVVSERTPGHGGSHAAPILARAMETIWPEVQKMVASE